MSDKFSIILDEYYPNAKEIRELALNLDYKPKSNATYPGGEAYSNEYNWESVRNNLMKYITASPNESPPEGKNFLQGKFRLALEIDNKIRPDGIHQDIQRYSGIIYLSKNEDLQGGIGLYKCKYTEEIGITAKWLEMISTRYDEPIGTNLFLNHVQTHLKNWDNWIMIGELPMRFNRAIILMAHCFHASTGIFGSEKKTGRLTQHFEFYLQ